MGCAAVAGGEERARAGPHHPQADAAVGVVELTRARSVAVVLALVSSLACRPECVCADSANCNIGPARVVHQFEIRAAENWPARRQRRLVIARDDDDAAGGLNL